MSKVCIFYRVKTQFDNLGDAIINRMLIEALSKHADEIKIDASLAPLDFKEQLGINKKNGINPSFFYIKMIFKCLKGENIYYFLNPGGERGGISNSLYLKKMLNNIVLSMLSFIGIKLCVYGVSYESLCKKSVKVLKRKSSILHFHGVRDTISINYLNNLGIFNVSKVPDLAFGLFNIFQYERADKSSCIAVSLRDEGVDFIHILSELYELLEVKEKYIPVTQVKRDYGYMKSIASSRIDMFSQNFDNYFDVKEVMHFYAHKDIVISNRLHVLILAMIAGANCIALLDREKNKKIIGLLNDLNLSDIIFFHDEVIDKKRLINSLSVEMDIKTIIKSQVVEMDRIFDEIFDDSI